MLHYSPILTCGGHFKPVAPDPPGSIALAFNGVPAMPFALLASDGTAAPIDKTQVDAVALSNGSYLPKTDGTANFKQVPVGVYKIVVAGTDLGTTPADVVRAGSDGSVFVYGDELSQGYAFTVIVYSGAALPVSIASDFSSYTAGTCC